ncbi:MAG: formiminotetrahydrofolate cyclodeaminase [Dinoroseobacter sp.]
MSLANESIHNYLESLSSRKSTPGGGAAAALTGAQAAGLMSMVVELSKDFPDDAEKMVLLNTIKAAVQQFTQIADEDAAAFSALMQTYRNKGDVQAGLKAAAAAPLACLTKATQLTHHLHSVQRHGNSNLITDTAIAALLLRDTILASELNVLINLRSIEDVQFTQSALAIISSSKDQIEFLESVATNIRQQLS